MLSRIQKFLIGAVALCALTGVAWVVALLSPKEASQPEMRKEGLQEPPTSQRPSLNPELRAPNAIQRPGQNAIASARDAHRASVDDLATQIQKTLDRINNIDREIESQNLVELANTGRVSETEFSRLGAMLRHRSVLADQYAKLLLEQLELEEELEAIADKRDNEIDAP